MVRTIDIVLCKAKEKSLLVELMHKCVIGQTKLLAAVTTDVGRWRWDGGRRIGRCHVEWWRMQDIKVCHNSTWVTIRLHIQRQWFIKEWGKESLKGREGREGKKVASPLYKFSKNGKLRRGNYLKSRLSPIHQPVSPQPNIIHTIIRRTSNPFHVTRMGSTTLAQCCSIRLSFISTSINKKGDNL
jgi:hypothetical protein